jgi:UDP-N-acetylmuramoylalanine--D-glutamate ligase
MFKLAGTNTGMAGNVGKSFAWQVAHYAHESYVLELSSFQLEGIQDFKPDVAIILNITPDHLDRYNYNLSEYVEAKFAIAANMRKEDKLICCADDPVIMDRLAKHPVNPETFYFSVEKKRGQTAYINNDQLIIKTSKNSFAMNIDDLSLKGTHNTYNSMAAGITGRLYELRKETIRESLSSFAGVEHRLEKFLKIRDVQFINDSKATNINSTWYALESVSENVVWISGGIDKGNDYEMLRELVRKKVKAIVCLGKDNSKIHEAFEREDIPLVDAGSMEEAVQQSFKLAGKGDTVLLSPACASFDLFDNYEDRGNQFKQCVRSL